MDKIMENTNKLSPPAVILIVSVIFAIGFVVVDIKQDAQKLEKSKLETKLKQALVEAASAKAEAEKVQREVGEVSFNPPANSVLCNGKYWTPTCPTGQTYYCPPAGDAQCIVENTQPSSGLQNLKTCMEQAIQDYQKMAARAKIEQEQCEKEATSPLGSIACSIRHSPPTLSISHCTSGGTSNNQPTYSPPPTYSPLAPSGPSAFDEARSALDKIEQERRLKDLENAEFKRQIECLQSGGSPCF